MRLASLIVVLAACSHPADSPTDATSITPDSPVVDGPRRLRASGQDLVDNDGTIVHVRGVNLRDNLLGDDPEPDFNPDNCVTTCPPNEPKCSQKSGSIVTADEVDDIVDTLHLDFVRLRVSFEGINRNDCDPDGTNMSADLRAKLDDAVNLLAARHVWMLIEMRTSDTVANAVDLYTPGTPDFIAYSHAWTYLASHYANTDYIAGYGILAEPSPDVVVDADHVVETLTGFQNEMMTTIDAQDHRTLLFIGPASNYDTLGYRWDAYATAFPAFAGRIAYEVNLLSPKPWIGTGLDPDTNPASYPMLPGYTADELTAALLAPSGNLTVPRDDEKLFTKNRDGNFAKLMNPSYLAWHLGWARTFAETHHVPMVVDQFGATATVSGTTPPTPTPGQLAYEHDLIDAATEANMGWCRWLYSTPSMKEQVRDIVHNPVVHAFYAGL